MILYTKLHNHEMIQWFYFIFHKKEAFLKRHVEGRTRFMIQKERWNLMKTLYGLNLLEQLYSLALILIHRNTDQY